jgi:hypothetical protein
MTEAWHPCPACGVTPAARAAAELADPIQGRKTITGVFGRHCLGGRQCYDRGHCTRCGLCLDWAFSWGLLALQAAYYRTGEGRSQWVRGEGHWEVVPLEETSDTETEPDAVTGQNQGGEAQG